MLQRRASALGRVDMEDRARGMRQAGLKLTYNRVVTITGFEPTAPPKARGLSLCFLTFSILSIYIICLPYRQSMASHFVRANPPN